MKLHLLILGALMTFGVAISSASSLDTATLVLVAAAAGVVALAGGVHAYRAEPLRAARSALLLGSCAALVFAARAFADTAPGVGMHVSAALFAALAVTGGVARIRLRRLPPAAPDILGERFGTEVQERHGVQFVGRSSGEVTQAVPGEIALYLQNTWDGPRKVTLRLRGRVYGARLTFPERVAWTLQPLEVGILTIPVGASPGDADVEEVFVAVDAGGMTGRRVRLEHAPEPRRMPWFMRPLAFLGGVSGWQGGTPIVFRLAAVPAGPERRLSEPRWETLWTREQTPGGGTPLRAMQ